jgi:Flp pilus assembly pilin Flp
MQRLWRVFLNEDSGQDLIEYTLLIAFVALTSAGLFMGAGANASQAWSSANSVLTTAADGSSGSTGGSGGGGDHGGDH